MNKIAKSIILIAIALLLLSSFRFPSITATTDGSWVTKTSMPTARAGLGVAVVNGRIYAIGGLNNNTFLSVNEEYDPASDTWTTKAPMPTARSGFAIAVYQNKIYAFGGTVSDNGVVSGFTGKTEVYNPATDVWTTKAPMPTPRADLSANVVNGKIYLIGGQKHLDYEPYYSEVNTTEVYDPSTDSWTAKSPMPNAAFGFASTVVNNKIYIMGGAKQFWQQFEVAYVVANQVYDPENDTWTFQTIFPSAGGYMAAAATSGIDALKRIYVAGGFTLGGYSNETHMYDPESDKWSIAASMLTPRMYLGLAVVDDCLYAIGGYDGNNWLNTNEEYTPTGYGTVPPQLSILSPENETYNRILLVFTSNKPTEWMGYSLDDKANVTVSGNTTLSALSQGSHSIVVYANDSRGNVGSSNAVHFSVDTVPPTILILFPENKTYDTTDIQPVFTVNEPVSWMAYSLDGGEQINITGNITLTVLSEGSHSLKFYARDDVGNVGSSETIYFSIQLFPTTLVIAATTTIVIVSAGGYLLLKRRKGSKKKKALG